MLLYMEEIGIILSVLTAISWSLATVLYKIGLKRENLDVIVANGVRTILCLIFMFIIAVVVGEINQINKLPVWIIFLIVVDVLFGIFLGDTLFLVAIRDAGVALGHPVSYTYSLFAVVFAYLLLQEPVNIWTFISAIIVISGVFLLFFKVERSVSKHMVKGLIAAILASFSWGISMIILKIILLSTSPILLNFIRLLALNIIIWTLIPVNKRKRSELRSIDKKTLVILSIGGFFR